MIAEHRHDRDADGRQFAREHPGLVRQAVVGEIARQQEQVGRLAALVNRA